MQPARINLPPSLLECKAEPALPTPLDDTAFATWVLDLIEAGDDCRATVSILKQTLGDLR